MIPTVKARLEDHVGAAVRRENNKLVFRWCVRTRTPRQRMLISGLIIFLSLFSSKTEQISHAKLAAGTAVDASRKEAVMPRKFSRFPRNTRREKFHFETLEPRQMFSASGGLTLQEILALRQDVPTDYPVEAPGVPDAPPPSEGHAEHSLTNFLYLPMVSAGQNVSVSANTTLQLNAEVVVNSVSNLSLQWTKLSGPGTVTFGNSNLANSTVQFNQAGTYVLQLAATNHGLTALAQLTVSVTFGSVVNIDQAWLNARGDGPYYLDQAGKTYVLQTDVATPGTAFAIIANDITLDLNGHTITYNNSAPITVPNGSFETGTGAGATGWNFANAANAQRFQGEFLQNTLYDGNYSLRFAPGFSGTQTVTSTGTVTLEPNTTYSLSAMLGHIGWVKDTPSSSFVRLVGQNVNKEHEVLWDTRNNRGIQWREAVFTTGDSAETYKIVVGADNPSAVAGFEAYIDDIKIQRTKVYGVATNIGKSRADYYPGIDQYGGASNVVIRNGTVTQGSDNATNSHGIYAYSTNAEIAHMTITVGGANSNVINGQYSQQSNIHHNMIFSNVRTIKSRDQFDGAVISSVGGSIHNNTIIGGPHTGILTMGTKNQIYDNTISIRSHYTNGFAITAWNDKGSEIYGNTIELTTEDFGGRGIMLDRKHDDVPDQLSLIHDNVVNVREVARNQEYRGAVLGGAYGIQLEAARNAEIYGNTVNAVGADAPAYALRLNHYDTGDYNLYIHDNTFRGIAGNSGQEAFSTKIDSVKGTSEVRIEDNVFTSDYGWLGETRGTVDLILLGNTLTVEGDGAGFIPVQGINYGTNEANLDVRSNKGIKFIDSIFASATARTKFENEPIDNWYSAFGGVEPYSWLFGSWSTTIVVKDGGGTPLAGATVKINDQLGNEVFAGNTDANGRVIAVLNQFKMQGSEKTNYGPYTVTTLKGGVQAQSQVTADRVQTVNVSLAVSPTSAAVTDSQADLSGVAAIAGWSFVRGFQSATHTGSDAEGHNFRQQAFQASDRAGGELGTAVMNTYFANLGAKKQYDDSPGVRSAPDTLSEHDEFEVFSPTFDWIVNGVAQDVSAQQL